MSKKKNGKNSNSKMQGSKMVQSKNWSFTYFEREDWSLDDFADRVVESIDLGEPRPSIIRSLAMGLETCPKTQRQHYQGFLQTFTKRMSSILMQHRCQLIVLPDTCASG